MISDSDVQPLTPRIGVEITNFDPSRGISPADEIRLRQLFDDNQLLVFRGLQLPAQDHVRLLSILGPVMDEKADGSFHSFVSNERADGILGERNLTFHSDFGWSKHPNLANSLYAVNVKGRSVPTDFVNSIHACATLPEDIRTMLENKTAVHVNDYSLNKDAEVEYQDRVRLLEMDPMPPASTHPRVTFPVIRPHPRTGALMLYVTEQFTSHIERLTSEESEALVQRLYQHLYKSSSIYSHHWRNGDLVVWDNIAIQHGRKFGHGGEPAAQRTLRRVCVNEKTTKELFAGISYNRNTFRHVLAEQDNANSARVKPIDS